MKRICLLLWHPPVRLLAMVAGALLCSAFPMMAALQPITSVKKARRLKPGNSCVSRCVKIILKGV
ncbi:hypothetical protein CBI35_09995 [Pantoea sp. AV62]|nr:hypothetical protein CBI35_09995 [Pantoea sp. AV62]